MNVHLLEVFNNVLHIKPWVIPDIMSFVSLEPDAVRLKIEEIKHNIQDATYNYLIKIPTPNTNLLNTADDTIKYIKAS